MTSTSTNEELVRLSWKYVVGIWALLILLLLPVLAFIILAEREVSQYSTLTFESHVRKAIEERAFSRAVRICSGALKTGISRSDYWGKAYLLRAEAYAGEEQMGKAVDDLETSARQWSRAPYNATEADFKEIAKFGTDVGLRLLNAGHLAGAQRAISAAAMGSGHPVEYLHKQAAALPASAREALWPDGPCITIEGYGGEQPPEFTVRANDQERKLLSARIENGAGHDGGPCAYLDISAATTPATSAFLVPATIPLSQKPFALRLTVKEDPPVPTQVFLIYWFDLARKSAVTSDSASTDLGGGWKRFEVKRNFYEERAAAAKKEGYDPVGGVINKTGLSFAQGPALKCWIGKIEMFIPEAEARP